MSVSETMSDNGRCRLCVREKPNQISVFRRNLSMRIMKLADVVIREDDWLPKTICLDCEIDIEKCFEFIARIQWADKKFRDEANQIEVEESIFIKQEHCQFENFMEEDCDDVQDHCDSKIQDESDKLPAETKDEIGQSAEPFNLVEIIKDEERLDLMEENEERSNNAEAAKDPLSQGEPFLEVQGRDEYAPAIDPLICLKEEAEAVDLAPSTSTKSSSMLKGRPLKKRLGHIHRANTLHETPVSRKKTQCEVSTKLCLDKRKSIDPNKSKTNQTFAFDKIPDFKKKIMAMKNLKLQQKRAKVTTKQSFVKTHVLTKVYKASKKYLGNTEEDIRTNISSEPSSNHQGTTTTQTSVAQEQRKHRTLKIECQRCKKLFFNSVLHKKHLEECNRLEKHESDLKTNKNEAYRCNICERQFNCFKSWQQHNRTTHVVTVDVECCSCQAVFQTEKMLATHKNQCPNILKTCSKKSDFLCSKCGFILKSRESLHRHNKRFHVDVPARIMCDICGKVFKFTSRLTSHKNFMHPAEKDKVSCHICNKEFLCQVRFKKHLRTTHCATRNYVCEVCKKAFKDKKTLVVHLTVHAVEKSFKCEVCDKAFRTKYKLRTHLTTHTDEQFKCKACYRIFLSKENLEIHIDKAHKNILRNYQCSICDEEIQTHSQFQLHKKFHENPDIQLFFCDLCGKLFDSKVKCERHRLYHDIDNKQLHCSICNKTFKNNKILKHHVFMHTNDAYLYKCEICDKSFKHSGAFYSHQRVHNDSSYFECKQCNEKFRWKQTYNKHVPKCHRLKTIDVAEVDINEGSKIVGENTQVSDGNLQLGAAITWCFD